MKSHMAESTDLFNREGMYPQLIKEYENKLLDNFTDCLMYATAIHPGTGNPVRDAVRNARYGYEDLDMLQSLVDYANDAGDKENQRYEVVYPRYWHGYLVILKPLLLFFNVNRIRMLNGLLFQALGMATGFMDLLTYPLITLGLPLVLLLLLFNWKQTGENLFGELIFKILERTSWRGKRRDGDHRWPF